MSLICESDSVASSGYIINANRGDLIGKSAAHSIGGWENRNISSHTRMHIPKHSILTMNMLVSVCCRIAFDVVATASS